jgi:hypothetical protein
MRAERPFRHEAWRRLMVRRFALAIAAAVVAHLLMSGVVKAQTFRQPGIYPVFDGWETLSDGSMEFYFGYMNRHPNQVTIPLGPDNQFEPAPGDQNQPTNFLPGRQEHVFTIRKPKGWNGKLVWTLKSEVGIQKANGSPNQLYILEVEEEEPGEHIVPPAMTARDVAGKVGEPIGLTAEVKATPTKERVIEGSGPRSSGLSVAWSLYRGPGTVSFSAVPGTAPAPRPTTGRGGRPVQPTPGVFTTECAFPITASCGAAQATFSAPGEYVLRAVAQQQRERTRAFVRVGVSQ